jgi:hypothetical protein
MLMAQGRSNIYSESMSTPAKRALRAAGTLLGEIAHVLTVVLAGISGKNVGNLDAPPPEHIDDYRP